MPVRKTTSAESLDLWVRQAAHGDADAFNRLIEHFESQLYQIAYYQLGDPEDALDACQEAVLSAWKGAAGFEGTADDYRRWITRITVNACRDRVRYEARRPRQRLEFERDGRLVEIPLPDPGQSPEAYAESADLHRLLEACLRQLTDEHRTVVLLDHLGYDYREMAEILAVEIGTVKSRLSRARAHLRDLLLGGREPAAAEPRVDERRSDIRKPDGDAGTGSRGSADESTSVRGQQAPGIVAAPDQQGAGSRPSGEQPGGFDSADRTECMP